MAKAHSFGRPDSHPQLASAWDKGQRAGREGVGPEANPYDDHRTHRGAVTFSRAFRRAWEDGRIAGAEERVR